MPKPGLRCLTLLLMPLIAAAGPVASEDTVKLVTGPHYAPFAAEHLPSMGLGPYLITKIFEASGRDAIVELRPWNRAYRESLEGKYDAVLPYIETSERRDDYLFSQPVFKVDTHAYVMADSDMTATSMEDLQNTVYCNPLGFADGVALQVMRSKGQITRLSAANLQNCFKMLSAGRADFVKINRYVANYIIQRRDLSADKIRALPFLVERISLHMMVPKTRPDASAFVAEFDRVMSEAKDDGRIEQWTKDYLETIDSGLPIQY